MNSSRSKTPAPPSPSFEEFEGSVGLYRSCEMGSAQERLGQALFGTRSQCVQARRTNYEEARAPEVQC